MKTELLAQMERYFEGGDNREHFSNIERNELFAIATVLDPRCKTRGFSKRENVIIAKDLLFAELFKIEREPTSVLYPIALKLNFRNRSLSTFSGSSLTRSSLLMFFAILNSRSLALDPIGAHKYL